MSTSPCWIPPGHSRAVGRSRAMPLLRPEVRWRAGVAGGGTDGPGGLHLHWPRFIIIYLLSKCSFIDTYWFIYWYLDLLLCIYIYIYILMCYYYVSLVIIVADNAWNSTCQSSFLTLFKIVQCNPDVAPRWNYGRVAYFWTAMSVDFQYVDVYAWSSSSSWW